MAQHLTFVERERISQMHEAGISNYEIAQELKRARSTVGRELRRNSWDGLYSAVIAQQLSAQRRGQRPLVRKMDRAEVNRFVRRGLIQKWSPDQIAGRSRRVFEGNPQRQVSAPTIYTWIARQSSLLRAFWRDLLRRRGRRKRGRDGRGRLTAQTSIEGRPQVVDRRSRFGDWEGDTMGSSRHHGALVTLVERKSGFLRAAQSPDRRARPVRRGVERLLKPLPAALRRTITFDNGKEFAEHQRLVQQMHLQVYFARPYCAWQRGTNENTNGLLRQFFPKGTDFGKVTWHFVQRAVQSLNDRPRKRLDYRTPREVLKRYFPTLNRCI